jgi:negative regulator of sigma-B (phosphoserine phosphatase)
MKFGIVERPKQGQKISGDAVFIHDGQARDQSFGFALRPSAGGPRAQDRSESQVLVAVIDGLGAGEIAAEVSARAMECIRRNVNAPLTKLVTQCHYALQGTRGAVMAVMRVDLTTKRISFVGVGNIGVRSRSAADVNPISRNGIVGFRLPTLKEFSYNYTPGDLFVFFSDGVSNHLSLDNRDISPINFRGDPQGLAEAIVARYGKRDDDVTVVVMW